MYDVFGWEFLAVTLAYLAGGAMYRDNDSIWPGWISFALLLAAFVVVRAT